MGVGSTAWERTGQSQEPQAGWLRCGSDMGPPLAGCVAWGARVLLREEFALPGNSCPRGCPTKLPQSNWAP